MSRAAMPVQRDAIACASDAVNVADVAVCFVNNRIHPIISAIVALADFEGADAAAIRTRLGLILDFAKVGRIIVEDAGGFLETERDDMLAKLTALKEAIQ
ncbi:hypothetical protein LXA47_19915 [Massilia sp. P8910]|uniref:hypothetical protein n=1 Tax=Massilia antarctica TaxID=2765360 RepID=UPI001E394918|nr:hypothetical protein [Massilia antarctica]MCE3605852.1 hypothetical protein [Massilia antarctica]